MERPIIFSAPMVRALLEGRKTQTRRIIKPQPSDYIPGELRHAPKHPAPYFDAYNGGPHWCWWSRDDRQGPDWIRCPYGVNGDRLWVRETYQVEPSGFGPTRVYYPADDRDQNVSLHHDRVLMGQAERLWTEPDVNRPSIHMPRWASRLTLEVTQVRVQRLQEISEEDAQAEGVENDSDGWRDYQMSSTQCTASAADSYQKLWNSLHGDASWNANPWVWAVSFEGVSPSPLTGEG